MTPGRPFAASGPARHRRLLGSSAVSTLGDRYGAPTDRQPPTWASVPEDYDVRIRALRRASGMSQAQLATLVGAARKAVVYQWEARKRTPSPPFWQRIAALHRRLPERPYAGSRGVARPVSAWRGVPTGARSHTGYTHDEQMCLARATRISTSKRQRPVCDNPTLGQQFQGLRALTTSPLHGASCHVGRVGSTVRSYGRVNAGRAQTRIMA